jgi:hypothetical protein
MKKAALIFIAIVTFGVANSTVKAQTDTKEQVVVVIDNPGSDRAFQDKEKKKLDLSIKGLSDQSYAAFTEKVKKHAGVKSFELSDKVVNGTRKGHIEFNETFDKAYFQQLLADSGVDMMIHNGKRTVVKGTK